jgi:hypothetical protein
MWGWRGIVIGLAFSARPLYRDAPEGLRELLLNPRKSSKSGHLMK